MSTISLNHGYESLVDEADVEALSGFNWLSCVKRWTNKKGEQRERAYALANSPNGVIYMHRFLMNAPKGLEVDHRNGNSLDNRRSNLRLATHGQNISNQKGWAKSGFKGVRQMRNGRWSATASHSGKTHRFGQYVTAEDAAIAYDKGVLALRGEFAVLNLPNDFRPVLTCGQRLKKRQRQMADRVLGGTPVRAVAAEFGVTIMTVHNVCLRLGLRSNRFKIPAYLPASLAG
jgi:hypothetical protein